MGVILLSKIKIHELAKKLNLNSKDLVEKAKQIGMDVKNHLSGITEDEAEKLEKQYKQQSNDVQSEKKEKPVANKKEKFSLEYSSIFSLKVEMIKSFLFSGAFS